MTLRRCRENGAQQFVTDIYATFSRIGHGLLPWLPVSTIGQEGDIPMTTKPLNTAPAPKTFSDVMERIREMDELSKSRRRDIISALRSMNWGSQRMLSPVNDVQLPSIPRTTCSGADWRIL